MSDSALSLFSKNKLPAYLSKLGVDETSKALMGSGGGNRISIRGGVFRKVVGGKEVMVNEDRAMNVIILRAAEHVSRTYFAGTYEEGSTERPACWSSDGVRPDADVTDPQSDLCATCPMNVAGSGPGDTKACRYNQRVALVLDGDLEGDILSLSLPAQSLFGKGDGEKMPLQQYARFLAGHNVPITAVVTEMRFDINSATPKLTFKPIRPLTEDEYNLIQERRNEQEALDAVKFLVSAAADAGDDVSEATKGVLSAAAKPAVKEDGEEQFELKQQTKPTKPARSKGRPAVKPREQPVENPVASTADDEEAALLAQLAAVKARKAAEEKAKAAAKAAAVDDDMPTVRGTKSAAQTEEPASVADIMAKWAGDDEGDATDD